MKPIAYDPRAPKFSNARALVRTPYVTARKPLRVSEIVAAMSAAAIFVLILF